MNSLFFLQYSIHFITFVSDPQKQAAYIFELASLCTLVEALLAVHFSFLPYFYVG